MSDVLISFVDIKSRADMQITNGAREGDLNHRTFPDTSEKGFYPVLGVNASIIRPFSISKGPIWYNKTTFVDQYLIHTAHATP